MHLDASNRERGFGMISGKTVLAIVTARGGSKGVPRKNIRLLGGKPLLLWSFEAAADSRYIDRCVLSSEDEEIIAVSRKHGYDAPFARPRELAADDTPGVAPVLHALTALPECYDLVVLLQPTSPLRLAEDIDGALEACVTADAPACVSISPAAKSPYLYQRMDAKGRLVPLLDAGGASRRQDMPETFTLNGAVYVAKTSFLHREKTFFTQHTIGYVMPEQRSLDIDSELDFSLCECLLDSRRG